MLERLNTKMGLEQIISVRRQSSWNIHSMLLQKNNFRRLEQTVRKLISEMEKKVTKTNVKLML